MIIERTRDEVFRLPDMKDFFEFKEISKKSTASQEDVHELVKTIKKGRWAKTKSKLDL